MQIGESPARADEAPKNKGVGGDGDGGGGPVKAVVGGLRRYLSRKGSESSDKLSSQVDKLNPMSSRMSLEQRRDLLASYDLFLADDRILPMLCKVLTLTREIDAR